MCVGRFGKSVPLQSWVLPNRRYSKLRVHEPQLVGAGGVRDETVRIGAYSFYSLVVAEELRG